MQSMKRFSFRKAAIIFLILAAVVAILLQTIILLPFLAIGLEDTFRKWKINNPYVNNRFRDCQKITLDTSHTICIPEEWLFEESDGIYKIYDQDSNLWAIGRTQGTEYDRFADDAEFLEAFLPFQDIDITYEYYPPISFMEEAHITRMHVCGSNGSTTLFHISLMDISGADTCFVLLDDIQQNACSFDVAEAIMYSFAWPNKTKRAQTT